MPWATTTRPSLSLSQFKGQLAEAGLCARVYNFNLAFAKILGFDRYETISRIKGVSTQVGEWLFAEAAFKTEADTACDAFLRLAEAELPPLPRTPCLTTFLRQTRAELVGPFLEECAAQVQEAEVIGFSCSFFQTVPSLALGRMLKERSPSRSLVYGGASCQGEMGLELFERCSWIDVVALGEADAVVVPLFEALAGGRAPGKLPGVLCREGMLPAEPVTPQQLDAVADPEFDDYFEDVRRVGLSEDVGWQQRLVLPFEASRGCWWGERQHCTFCGLNAEEMTFRRRSPARVVRQLRALVTRWGTRQFFATDNILAPKAYEDLLPELDPDRTYFWEIKANVHPWQVEALAQANVRYVQPGIESLSTEILRGMRKGVTAIQNVHLLKLCRSHGITPFWNLLIRVPGETPECYRQMETWIPSLFHLMPPNGGATPIECHRFSPYHTDWRRFANAIRPRAWYRWIYPDDFDLMRIAYYFDLEWRDVLEPDQHRLTEQLCGSWLRSWRDQPFAPRLVWLDGGRRVEDTRAQEGRVWLLDDEEATILRAFDAPCTADTVACRLRVPKSRVGEVLATLYDAGLVLEDRGVWLGLPLDGQTSWEPPLSLRRRLFKQGEPAS